MFGRRSAALLVSCALLSGCGPEEPLRIGFIGGQSSRLTVAKMLRAHQEVSGA